MGPVAAAVDTYIPAYWLFPLYHRALREGAFSNARRHIRPNASDAQCSGRFVVSLDSVFAARFFAAWLSLSVRNELP